MLFIRRNLLACVIAVLALGFLVWNFVAPPIRVIGPNPDRLAGRSGGKNQELNKLIKEACEPGGMAALKRWMEAHVVIGSTTRAEIVDLFSHGVEPPDGKVSQFGSEDAIREHKQVRVITFNICGSISGIMLYTDFDKSTNILRIWSLGWYTD